MDVTIGDEMKVFTAHVDRSDRWNGWLACPYFDRDEADRVAEWINDDLGYDNGEPPIAAEWAIDVLFITEYLGDSNRESTTRIAPDFDGRYAIGAYAWCWTERTSDATTDGDA